MNKKSNIIVGLSVVVVIAASVFGMSVFSKGGGEGKGNQPPQAVQKVIVPEQSLEINKDIGSVGTSTPAGGGFVASKQGKKYFPMDCGSAKTIKEENRVYFSSEEEAKQAGYERTLTCK